MTLAPFARVWDGLQEDWFSRKGGFALLLRARWTEIAGQAAEYSSPEQLSGEKLLVLTDSTAHAEALAALKAPILARLAKRFPRMLVRQITVQVAPERLRHLLQSPAPSQPEPPELTPDEYDEIRQTLAGLDGPFIEQFARIMIQRKRYEKLGQS